jgi:hypothetical protein
MLDYLIAVAVALIGLVVVYSMFTMIDSKDVVVVKTAKPSSPKKSPSPSKATKAQRKAQREEDEIIAKELALATSGMHSDKRDAKITTLDEYRSNKKEKLEQRKTTGPVQTAFTSKQVEMDKEQGFSVVKREAPKKKQEVVNEEVISQKEALDRKLGQFFRAAGKKGKDKKNFLGNDEPATEGGKVIMKGTIGSSRTW